MKKILILLGVIVIAIYILSTTLVSVTETEIVVVTQFGNPVKVVTEAGLLFKMPDPIQTVMRLDKRIMTLDFNLGELLTSDKKNLIIGSFSLWKIKDARKFIQSVRDVRSAKRRLSDLISSELGIAIGTHPLSDFLTTSEKGSKINEIFAEVLGKCQKHASDEFGVELVDVHMRRLGFPSQNLRSVYDRMRAERERMAKKYRAEGEEEAAKIRAKTDKEVREMLANAYRESQITRGHGEADAIRIYAEAFQKDPKFYKLTRTLEAYKKMLDEQTTLILSSKSPLFKYLETPPGN